MSVVSFVFCLCDGTSGATNSVALESKCKNVINHHTGDGVVVTNRLKAAPVLRFKVCREFVCLCV